MPDFLRGPEILILVVVLVLLFGGKRLPDAARGLGRSLRIFKSEVRGMKDDDAAARTTVEQQPTVTAAPPQPTPVVPPVVPPVVQAPEPVVVVEAPSYPPADPKQV